MPSATSVSIIYVHVGGSRGPITWSGWNDFCAGKWSLVQHFEMLLEKRTVSLQEVLQPVRKTEFILRRYIVVAPQESGLRL